MAKKSSNPVDAYRKAQRAKELKKNKEGRKKTRDTQTIKKDTRDLENEIRQLKDSERSKKLDGSARSRLTELESELAHVNKVKEAYVSEHPEARDKVFRQHREGGPRREGDKEDDVSHLYTKEGKLRDPTRSVYFDPVYNPFGAPPPGMPYRERTPDDEDEEDEDSEEDSDDDVVMPEGPPPGHDDDDESDDSDDIPLPEGPPPSSACLPPPPHSDPSIPFSAPFTPFPPPFPNQNVPYMPMPPFPPTQNFRPPTARPQHRPHPSHDRPPSIQDPLSNAPTQTYQGHRMAKHELPPRPPPPTPTMSAASMASATISAAPQLRDLRKEATAFVPRGVNRKKASTGGVAINAAPGAGEIDADGDEVRAKRADGGGLMGKLQGVLGDMKREEKGVGGGAGDEDYQKFLEGLGGLE